MDDYLGDHMMQTMWLYYMLGYAWMLLVFVQKYEFGSKKFFNIKLSR